MVLCPGGGECRVYLSGERRRCYGRETDTPLTQFPGVGEVRAKKLSHLGLNTAGDLLTYYPRDYEDRRQV